MYNNTNISKIGLGCVTFGREIDKFASFELMDYAVSRGINFFDTAAVYGGGESEKIIGAWLASRASISKNVIPATKILPPFTPETIEKSVDDSLKRLGIECIDLLYMHSWHLSVEVPEVLFTFEQLIRKGKIRKLGVSNFKAKQLLHVINFQKKHHLTTIQFVQNNHNLAISDLESELIRICGDNNLTVVTYSPLGAGFLTGKHQKVVQAGSRFDIMPAHQNIYFNEEANRRLKNLQHVAERTGHSMIHLALAWALHQSAVSSVLIGGRDIGHLEQAFAALEYNNPAIFSELQDL